MVWRAEGFSSGPRLAAPSLRACAIVQSSARYKSTCSKSSTSTPLSVWQLMRDDRRPTSRCKQQQLCEKRAFQCASSQSLCHTQQLVTLAQNSASATQVPSADLDMYSGTTLHGVYSQAF